jgi:hypothetical protein
MTHQEPNEAYTVTTTSEPFREKPAHVPAADYDRVVVENQKLRSGLTDAQKSQSRAETLGKIARGIGWFAATVPIVSIVVFAFWFACIRGAAWGERARLNAEREAVAFATRVAGSAPDSVACGDESTAYGTKRCVALYRRLGYPITVQCDDDEPITNDGCDVVYAAGGAWEKPIMMVPFNGGAR